MTILEEFEACNPELIAAKARVKELEAALLKYGNHFPLECRRAFRHPQFDFNAPCSCGFDAYFALETEGK